MFEMSKASKSARLYSGWYVRKKYNPKRKGLRQHGIESDMNIYVFLGEIGS